MTKKLLWLSDSPLIPTGYATISTNLMQRLADRGWEIHYMAHNYLGQTMKPGEVRVLTNEMNKFTLYGAGREGYCKDITIPILREVRPQIYGILLDTFMLYPWYLEMDTAPSRTLFYFPSDGGGILPLGCENILRKVNVPVAMSKFAQEQAKNGYGINSDYIPHAVDEKMYRPLSKEEKEIAKVKYGLRNKFVVGTVARNQGRKMLDRTIKAFAQFCRDKPDAVLFMHTDPEDNAAVFNINELIVRYKIQNRVLFSGMKFYKGFSYNEMNEIYNLMDVFLLTTSGEGWGIPTTEAMSCGIPVVVTDYTTTKEMVTDHEAGLAVKVSAEITGSWGVERAVMDIDDCVAQLNKLYNNPELREKLGKNGRIAVLENYTWDKVTDEWEKLLNRMIEW